MKKIIITSMAVVALLASCSESEAEIEQGKKETAEIVEKITEKVIEKGDERKAEKLKITNKSMAQEFQIDDIYSKDEVTYLSVRSFELEEIENTQDPELPIAKVVIGEELMTFSLTDKRYADCTKERSFIIAELRKTWSENKDIPWHIKVVEGVAVEMYKDDCSE